MWIYYLAGEKLRGERKWRKRHTNEKRKTRRNAENREQTLRYFIVSLWHFPLKARVFSRAYLLSF